MKKLTLDQTWTECLKMWRWIVKELPEGRLPELDTRAMVIHKLKKRYCKDNNIKRLYNYCFFCEYTKGSCEDCPPRHIDSYLHRLYWCEGGIANNGVYSWWKRPRQFLRGIESLNRKRKQAKK